MKAKPLLVAIVGGSGSGKTWLAEKLAAEFDGRAVRLSLDDFYRDRSYLSPARRAKLNFDDPKAIDWKTFERLVKKLLSGHSGGVPQYDFKTHSRLPKSRPIAPKPMILVDGLWLLHRRSIRSLFHASFFLRCSQKTRFRRRLARDLRNRGRSVAGIKQQFRLTVAPMHDRFVEPQARWAGWVLREIPTDCMVKSLAEKLQRMANMLHSGNG
jgi:uridine kinase